MVNYFIVSLSSGYLLLFDNDTCGARVARVPVNKVYEPAKVAHPAEASWVSPPVQTAEVMLDVSVRDMAPQTFSVAREFV